MVSEKNSSSKPVTQKRLMNIALFYLGKYESSSENLRQVLQRRLARAEMKGAEIPLQAQAWIDAVIEEVKRLGYVDDKRFACSITEKYRKSGKSSKFIRQKLIQAGISSEMQQEALTVDDAADEKDSELQAALRLVRKKKLGAFRPQEERQRCRKKDLAVLARAGFSYQTAVEALGESEQGEDENVWD